MSRDKGDIASEQYTIEEDPGPWKFMAMFACEFASRSNETSQRKNATSCREWERGKDED